MRSAGARLAANERVAGEALQNLVERRRFLAAVGLIGGDHLDAIVRMVPDAPLDVVAVAVERSLRERDVLLEHLPGLELHAQRAVRLLLLGDEDRAGRIAV